MTGDESDTAYGGEVASDLRRASRQRRDSIFRFFERDRGFADSPAEESGFEPLVPLATEMLMNWQAGLVSNSDAGGRRHAAGAAVVSIQKWDQRFESAFLQRRVCELSVPANGETRGRRLIPMATRAP
jgi:hypothetical protein